MLFENSITSDMVEGQEKSPSFSTILYCNTQALCEKVTKSWLVIVPVAVAAGGGAAAAGAAAGTSAAGASCAASVCVDSLKILLACDVAEETRLPRTSISWGHEESRSEGKPGRKKQELYRKIKERR